MTSSIMASITTCGSPTASPPMAWPWKPARARPRTRGLERALAALAPAQRELHGAFNVAALGRQPHAFVELHGDIGAQQQLHLDRPLRRQFDLGAVDMRTERHPVFAE